MFVTAPLEGFTFSSRAPLDPVVMDISSTEYVLCASAPGTDPPPGSTYEM
jgi:hypothetical protein